MATPKREPAIRARLDGSTEAIVARSGVHILRGRDTFYLSDRAVDALVVEWATRRAWLEALGTSLRAEEASAGGGPGGAVASRERGGGDAGDGKR